MKPVISLLISYWMLLAACAPPAQDLGATLETPLTTSSQRAGSTTTTTTDFEQWAAARGLFIDGEWRGPTDEMGEPLRLEPIMGYSDLSEYTSQEMFDLDLAWLRTVVADCVIDQNPSFANAKNDGLPFWVGLAPPLDQIGWATYVACQEGLGRPPETPFSEPQWIEFHAYFVARLNCENRFGADWGPFPNVDELKGLIDPGPSDSPVDFPYSGLTISERDLALECPFDPVGGFGAWNVGDPVQPAP